jgi:apolipoprotein N-acyltransferase
MRGSEGSSSSAVELLAEMRAVSPAAIAARANMTSALAGAARAADCHRLAHQTTVSPPTPRGGFLARLGLMALSAGMMSLAYPPAGQWYLAWLAMTPWVLAVASARSAWRAALWGWFGGTLILLFNMLYLWPVRPVMPFALAAYLGLAAGVTALLARGAGWLDVARGGASAARRVGQAAAVAAVWVAMEWLRGNRVIPIAWLYLGHTQLPGARVLCQVADVTGAYGVSFCAMFVNTLAALTLLRSGPRRSVLGAWLVAAALIGAVAAYGVYRLSQHDLLSPGPKVLAVQTNDRDIHSPVTLARQRTSLVELLEASTNVMAGDGGGNAHGDEDERFELIVWPESAMPPLNDRACELLAAYPSGQFYLQVRHELHAFARRHEVGLITGGPFVDGEPVVHDKAAFADIRNSAYFFDPRESDLIDRYDKARLMPFGEWVPLRDEPIIGRLLLKFLVPGPQSYVLKTDPQQRLTVFRVRPRNTADGGVGGDYRFVSPICWDVTDPLQFARMFRPDASAGANPGVKRADFFAQLSNEAWFSFGEPAQHLQAAAFRCIENRVPAVRCVNGGVSAVIDSSGRVTQSLAGNTAGTLTGRLQLDARLSFYTRRGDVFAAACFAPLAGAVCVGLIRFRRRRAHHSTGAITAR